MAFATDQERRELNAASSLGLEFVVQVRKNGRESEFTADDIDHALDIQGAWINNHNADYVEIFRVLPDGSLNPTIGPYYRAGIVSSEYGA